MYSTASNPATAAAANRSWNGRSAHRNTKLAENRGTASRPSSAPHRAVSDRKRLVEHGKALRQLLLVDAQWGVGHHRPPPDERVHAVVEEVPIERPHLVAGPIEGGHRLHRGAVADQLEDAEQADVASSADGGVPLLQLAVVATHQLAHLPAVLDQPVLL